MKVLIACEESQVVCRAFREKGFEAYSCDLQDCSGGYLDWHIKGDVLPLINGKCQFTTCDGVLHNIPGKWDLIIAHPPCTRLCNSGQRWLYYGDEKYRHKKLCARLRSVTPFGVAKAMSEQWGEYLLSL